MVNIFFGMLGAVLTDVIGIRKLALWSSLLAAFGGLQLFAGQYQATFVGEPFCSPVGASNPFTTFNNPIVAGAYSAQAYSNSLTLTTAFWPSLSSHCHPIDGPLTPFKPKKVLFVLCHLARFSCLWHQPLDV